MKKQKIKGTGYYYALLCYGTEPVLICGVFAEKEEAEKVNKEIKDCPGKHKIKRCKIEIEL